MDPYQSLRNIFFVIICIVIFISLLTIVRNVYVILLKKLEGHRPLRISNSKKNTAIPVTGRGGPWGCERSKLPHFLDNRLTDGGEVVSLTRRLLFTPPGRSLILISVRE
jgi:hypothetical protein